MAKSTKKRDRCQTEEIILSAAMKSFSQIGFEATSTKSIAKEAGCAEGLIFKYFKDKLGLLRAGMRAGTKAQQSTFEVDSKELSNFSDELLRLFRINIDFMTKHKKFIRVALIQSIHNEEVSKIVREEIYSPRYNLYIKRILQYKKSGLIRLDIDESDVAHQIMAHSFHLGFYLPNIINMSSKKIDLLAQSYAKNLSNGLAKK